MRPVSVLPTQVLVVMVILVLALHENLLSSVSFWLSKLNDHLVKCSNESRVHHLTYVCI